MKLKTTLATALLLAAPLTAAVAQPGPGDRRIEVRPAPPARSVPPPVVRPPEVRPAPPMGTGVRVVPAPRPMPPRFLPHPVGPHPHGPIVRPHSVRVLSPRIVEHGHHAWRHWEHPEFARPVYYWDWANIHQVTCIAEDSYGDQYPVTETVGRGFGLNNMADVEDDALDRCNDESGGDANCYLATCTHY